MIALYEIQLNLSLSLIIIFTISYLIGSISFGILLTKIFKIGNLRIIGSGNIGATNVLRTGNKKAALATLILDAGKGFFIVYFSTLYLKNDLYTSIAAFGVFIGHLFPFYHKFRGGKGVATFIGLFMAINYFVGISICIIWMLIAFSTRFSSLAALLCTLTSPIFLVIMDNVYFVPLGIVLTFLIWMRHYQNIIRLLNKTEPLINLNNNKKL